MRLTTLLLMTVVGCDTPGPCPSTVEKFVPSAEFAAHPTACLADEDLGAAVVNCTPEWCASGYEDWICVDRDEFAAWADEHHLALESDFDGEEGSSFSTEHLRVECSACDGVCGTLPESVD